MIRMNKLTDYGVVLLTTFAREPGLGISARELSTRTGIPLPTVVKLLKTLLKAGLLVSQRGTKGGYALSRRPEEVPVAEVIEALEGPLAITECSMPGTCEHERRCVARPNWAAVNDVIRQSLSKLTLAEMTRPAPSRPASPAPLLPSTESQTRSTAP
ncbi:MAG: SUF system Fe-S cluster assembly regulator [Thermoanaerobaculia bacterium]|nr:SUF system Fe-S cluster assembly regulator [Thermoanaerobaculia bacterium]